MLGWSRTKTGWVAVAGEGPVELGLGPVELGQAVAGALVADVVDQAGDAVHREQVGPLALGQQPGRDREVLGRGEALEVVAV